MITVDTGKFTFTYTIIEIVEIAESVGESKMDENGKLIAGEKLPAEYYLLFYIPGSVQGVLQIRAYFEDLTSAIAAKQYILNHIVSHHRVVSLNVCKGFVKAQ